MNSSDLEKILNVIITNLKSTLPATDKYCRFVLVLKGSLSVTLDSENFEFTENDIFMIHAGMPLHVNPKSKNIIIILSLDSGFLDQTISNFEQIKCNSKKTEFAVYAQLKRIIAEMAKGFYAQPTKEPLFLISSLYSFLYILSSFKSDESADNDQSAEKYKNRVTEIKRYIRQNSSKQMTMNELAEQLHLTPQYMSKFFKQQFNSTFTDYLTAVRLDRAVFEIINSDETITSIAFNNGFPNLTSFNKAFRDKYNQTPLRYRKLNKAVRSPDHQVNEELFEEISSSEQFEVKVQIENIISSPSRPLLSQNTILYEKVYADCSVSSSFKPISFDVINLGFADNILSNEFQKQLTETQLDLKFKFGRFQNIIEPGLIDKMPNSNSYNFAKANRIIDFLYSINMLPYFEIGTKPRKINISSDIFLFFSDNSALLNSLEEWDSYLQAFLINCINRYGKIEVEKWKFELWLSHGVRLEYTEDRIVEFIKYSQVIQRVIKRILPGIQLGGFGFNITAGIDIFRDVLNRLRLNGVELDFLTLIAFHNELSELTTSGIPHFTTDSDYLSKQAEMVKNELPARLIPFDLVEWNFDFTARDFVNDSIFKALFIVKNLLENTQYLNSIGYWLLSDITSEYKDTDRILFGGNGLLTVDGLRKPAYYAYQVLSRLGNQLIKKGPGYIITTDENNTYQILLYNYVHPTDSFCFKFDIEIDYKSVNNIFDQTSPKEFVLELDNIASGNYRIKTYTLSKDHGSILDEWLKMGAIQNVTQGEINYFKSIAIPAQNIHYLTAENNLVIHDIVNPNEIHFLSIRLEI